MKKNKNIQNDSSRVCSLKLEIAMLKYYLVKFGSHSYRCDAYEDDSKSCTCGFNEVLHKCMNKHMNNSKS